MSDADAELRRLCDELERISVDPDAPTPWFDAMTEAEQQAAAVRFIAAARESVRLRVENEARRRVCVEAAAWLRILEEKGGRYQDGLPGELMDVVDALRATESKP